MKATSTLVEHLGKTNYTQLFISDSLDKLMEKIENVVSSNQASYPGSLGAKRKMGGVGKKMEQAIIYWLTEPRRVDNKHWIAECTAFSNMS